MAYDGDGNRVRKTVSSTGVTTYYLVDDRNPSGYVQVVEEWTGSGSTANLSRVYNYGLGLISQAQPAASTCYFITDGHGSTRMLVDNNDGVQNAFAYDAYGSLIASNTTAQTAYLYGGQQWDSDLGIYYNRARYLNQNTGRFWTRDTYAGDKNDPKSLHKYLYCAGNPINLTDPSGHDFSGIGVLLGIYGALFGTLSDWDVQAYDNVPTSGVGTSDKSTGGGNHNGFKVAYNGGGDSDGGKVIVYQTIEANPFYGPLAKVDRGTDMWGHAPAGVRLPPAMGAGLAESGDTYYVDSPENGNSEFAWKLTAVAVLRQNERDILLSTYYFEFDNKTRVVDQSNPNKRRSFVSAMHRWGVETGVLDGIQ